MSKIAIAGATTGTGTFTLASPATDTDRVLTLPDEVGTVVTTGGTGVVTSAMQTGDAVPIGVGQSWTDVAASRAVGTDYTNSTGKPIVVAITASGSSFDNIIMTLVIDGENIMQAAIALNGDGASRDNVTGIVPNGATYRVNVDGGSESSVIWKELR